MYVEIQQTNNGVIITILQWGVVSSCYPVFVLEKVADIQLNNRGARKLVWTPHDCYQKKCIPSDQS